MDISNNNGPVSFDALKAAGVRVVGVKATEGNTFHDAFFAANFAHAVEAGMIPLPYHFARPNGAADGAAEADMFLVAVASARTSPRCGRMVLDYESTRDIAYARAFALRVKEKTGLLPIVYCSGGRVAELKADPVMRQCPFWIAAYPSLGSYASGVTCVMHQYTDALMIGGHKFDGNHIFIDPEALLLHPPVKIKPKTYGVLLHGPWGRGVCDDFAEYGDGRIKAMLIRNVNRQLYWASRHQSPRVKYVKRTKPPLKGKRI